MLKACIAVLAVLLAGCAINVTPESLLAEDAAHPPIAVSDFAARLDGVRLEPVSLRHADGVSTAGLHMIKPGSRAVIVYLSGNKMPIAERGGTMLARFAQLDADLYWLDYRGQGASDGRPNVEALQGDVADLIALAARSGKPIIVHGLSMGSLLAGRAARDPRVAALVLEGAITSIPQVVDATTPAWLRSVIHVDIDARLTAFDNVAQVRGFRRPLLLLVGSQDDETPPLLSRRLYEAAGSASKRLVVAEGKSHGDAMLSEEAIAAYRELIAGLR